MSYQRRPNPRQVRNHGAQMGQPSISHEIDRLNALLTESNRRSFSEHHRANQLSKELEDTKARLEKQKHLKEVFIQKMTEVREELERLERYSNPETLSSARIGSKVHSTIQRKCLKFLQRDYEELKVAYVNSQEKFSSELRLEKEKTEALQRLLDEAKLANEKMERLERYSNPETLSSARTDSNVHSTIERKSLKSFLRDYEELKVAYVNSQEKFSSELRLEKEKTEALQRLLDEAQLANEEMSNKHQVEVASLRLHVVVLKDQAAESKFQQDFLKLSMDKEIQALRTISEDAERKLKHDLVQMSTCCEQLKVAHAMSQEQFSSELRLEKEKTEALQRLLDEAKLVSNEVINKYQLEVESLHQQAVTLQDQATENERQKDLLKVAIDEEIQALCKVSKYAEAKGKKELEQMSTSFDQLKVSNDLDVEALKLVSKTSLNQLSEEIQASVPPREKKNSFWKRTRRFFGLGKPGSWKKNRDAST